MADGGYRVEVHGSVGGNLVVGDHNLIVNAQTGSSVTVLQEAQRPKPQRRPNVRVLPRRPQSTLGRDTELGRIAAAVVAQSSIQVYGPSGMGKSTLLRRAAYDLADESDGLAFLSVSGRNGEDVLQEIFEACYETSGYRPSTVEMRRLMAGIRTCVIADDLVATPDALGAILDTVADTAFVFSSTDRELWGQGQALELAGLPADAAISLVRQELGRDLTSPESAAVLDAWRATGGSPMSLLRAAAVLSHGTGLRPMEEPQVAPSRPTVPVLPVEPVSRIEPMLPAVPAPRSPMDDETVPAGPVPPRVPVGLDRTVPLGGDPTVAAALGQPPGDRDTTRITATESARIAATVAVLTPPQRDVYELLRTVPTARASVPVIAALAGAPDTARAEAATEALVRAGLVDRADDTYRIAADLAGEPGDPEYRRDIVTLVEAMLSWLARSSIAPRDAAEHAELIIALVDEATESGHADAGCRLARAAAATLALSLRWGAWRDLLMSGQAAAQVCGDREALAYFTHERGIRMLCLGQAAAAAAVLAAAAVMWQALGLTQSAALAAQAQAVAGGAGLAPIAPQPPAPQPSAPQPPAPQPPAPQPSAPQPPAPRRIVGRAAVRTESSGFPILLVSSIAVVVIALIVATILIVGRRPGHLAQPIPSVPASVSPTPALPAPVAFSDVSARGVDPNRVLDNDPSTAWSSTVSEVPDAQYWIGIDMGGVADWTGLSVTPRTPLVGFPEAFRIESSLDGESWTAIPGQDYNSDHPYKPVQGAQEFTFDRSVTARYIRLFAYRLSGLGTVTEGRTFFVLQLAEMHVLGP